CVTCHNPHVSVRETNKDVFNDACNNCHKTSGKSELLCTEPSVVRMRKTIGSSGLTVNHPLPTANCVNCHMPKSGSTDIPHVTVHDHYIRKPVTAEEKNKIKTFIGLYAINEKQPDDLTKAKAYINQYEKFDPQPQFLDSALHFLRDKTIEDILNNLQPLVQLYFIRQDFAKIISYAEKIGEEKLLENVLIKKMYSNEQAWTAYRIADSYFSTGNVQKAVKWFGQAVKLAPYNLEFRNKLGSAYMGVNAAGKAEEQFVFILKEHPKFIPAYTNLGYLKLTQNKAGEAEALYNSALKLDPDYEPLLLNLAGLKVYQKNYKAAMEILSRIVRKNPGNLKAKAALQQLMQLT
ncbi:MAG: tetratricopeptide repeat protein, partial [Bacteroidia bacterium]